mgnify:CR=1 FL=1|tara:strand:- start:97 stop:288 length:192 start_codon:yes stop_codon:yes gene_type:complete
MTNPETIIYTDKERIYCNGDFGNDHPRVYYSVPTEGFVVCGYCDIKFTRDESYKDYTHNNDTQ